MQHTMKREKIKNIIAVVLCIVISICGVRCLSTDAYADSSPIASNNIYYIRNYYTGKYMTVDGSSANSNVCQRTFTGNSNQQFKLSFVSAVGAYYYNIVPMNNTSLVLDLANNSTSNGANIKVFTPNPSYASAQQFKFVKNDDDTYRIIPKRCEQSSPNEALEVAGPSTADGANIQIWDYKAIANQKWIIESTTDSYANMCWDLPFDKTIANSTIAVTSGGHSYYDLDFDVAYDSKIYCPAPATVKSVGSVITAATKSMGKYVIVDFDRSYDGKPLTSRFLHMSNTANLSAGDHVTSYTLIGYVGNTGDVYPQPTENKPHNGTHLHMDVNTEGQIWGNYLNKSNTIPPEYFFPNANFRWF